MKNECSTDLEGSAWPMLLVCLSVFLWAGFQLSQVITDRSAMVANFTSQEKPLEDGQKVRKMLADITTGLQKLDKDGNANAKAIVEQLKKAKVINDQTNTAPAAAAPAAK